MYTKEDCSPGQCLMFYKYRELTAFSSVVFLSEYEKLNVAI